MKAGQFSLPQGPATQYLACSRFTVNVCSLLNLLYIHFTNIKQRFVPEGRSPTLCPIPLPDPSSSCLLVPHFHHHRPLGTGRQLVSWSLMFWPWSPGLGCIAYRDEKKGSDFIQTLVEVLRTDPGGDLLELLTEVSVGECRLATGGDSPSLQPWCSDHFLGTLLVRERSPALNSMRWPNTRHHRIY